MECNLTEKYAKVKCVIYTFKTVQKYATMDSLYLQQMKSESGAMVQERSLTYSSHCVTF